MRDTSPCSEALERIHPYLDGEMTRWRRWRVSRHLRGCIDCDGMYSFEDQLKALIKQGCAEDVPDEVVDRLKQFLRDNDCEC